MARHRRRRSQRPTIVIPGSSQLPGRPVMTTVMVAGSLLALPGLIQPGTGNSGPLEGSATLDPPTNALGIPRLGDYDDQGRLTLEAVPGRISSVAAVTLGPTPVIDVSPDVATVVAETIQRERQLSPLEAAMAFGPDEVETVKINELGIPTPVVGGGSDSGAGDPGSVALPEVGGQPEGEEAAGAAEALGRAVGEDARGEATEGAGGTGPGGAVSDGDAPVGFSDREAGPDSPSTPSAGEPAPWSPEGPRDSAPCPDEEALPSGGGTEGPERPVGSGVEGPAEGTSGDHAAEGDRDGGIVPVVEVDEGPGREVIEVPRDVRVDSPEGDRDDPVVTDPVDVDDHEPEVDLGGDNPGDSVDPDPVRDATPEPADEVVDDAEEVVPDPEPVVDEIIDEDEGEPAAPVEEVVEDVSEPEVDIVPVVEETVDEPVEEATDDVDSEVQEVTDGVGESDPGDDSSDDEPVVSDDHGSGDDEPADSVEEVEIDAGDSDAPSETDSADSGEDSREESDGAEDTSGSSDDSEDAQEDASGESESDSGDGDGADNSGSDSDESGGSSGDSDSGSDGSDSSDDGGSMNDN